MNMLSDANAVIVAKAPKIFFLDMFELRQTDCN